MLVERPDCSYVLSEYLKKFPGCKEAADILLDTLKRDPTYDAAAADYIDAMDVCEPEARQSAYRRVIETVSRRSMEKSILIRLAILSFRARRAGPKDAVRLIREEKHPTVKNMVLHRLFGEADSLPYKTHDCCDLLERGVVSEDEDYARCCAMNLIYYASSRGEIWEAPVNANVSVKTLLVGLGLRSKGPKRTCVLEGFFATIGIQLDLPWKKALSGDLSDAEHRCLRVQEFRGGDPTALVLMMDTFNEVLIQSFSRQHQALAAAYTRAAGAKPHPDYGAWLNNWMTNRSIVSPISQNAVQWLLDVHNARVTGDLAHAKSKKGRATKPISFKRAASLFGRGKQPWKELLVEWKKIL